MQLQVIDAREHQPENYAPYFAGHKAVRLLDDKGAERGEFVWRLAHGHSVEITEFGIYRAEDRRQGWGTMLLEAGLASIREFFDANGFKLRRIYLFCDSINKPARSFYEARGFRLAAVLPEFYHYCDAAMYVRDMSPAAAAATREQG